ncbi:MAG: DUF2855 family protein [Sneathiella sp.]
MSGHHWTIHIEKDDISQTNLVRSETMPSLAQGEIEVAVRRFALTANNITYATLGKSFGNWTDMPGYWAFFPTASDDKGQLPVWGFAEVTRSSHPDIQVGEELYGYFPMASHLIMRPSHISASTLVDGAEHRQPLAPVYNQYNRVSDMTELLEDEKDLWPVFRPLLVTGYMICDQYHENNYYGAEQILITSASSKTALMTAKCFSLFENAPKLVGVTSQRNKAFVEKSGLYDDVISYDQIKDQVRIPSAMIDMAGNGEVIGDIHHHFEDQLTFSLLVGISHWDAARPAKDLPGPKVSPFFAPGRIKQRTAEWGGGELRQRMNAAWEAFSGLAPALTELTILEGPKEAESAYKALVAGDINPAQSLVISL